MQSLHSFSSLSVLAPPVRLQKPTKTPNFVTIKSCINRNPKEESGSKARSWVSPDWLTSLTKSLTITQSDESNIPVASAKLDDVTDLLGGALFLPLFKWMNVYGPIYRLAAGPRNFVVVSDPAIAKHVLRNYGTKYAKGLVSEVSEFLFGSGFAIAEGPLWMVTLLFFTQSHFSFFFFGCLLCACFLIWTFHLSFSQIGTTFSSRFY